jgi:hypothetical protein
MGAVDNISDDAASCRNRCGTGEGHAAIHSAESADEIADAYTNKIVIDEDMGVRLGQPFASPILAGGRRPAETGSVGVKPHSRRNGTVGRGPRRGADISTGSGRRAVGRLHRLPSRRASPAQISR